MAPLTAAAYSAEFEALDIGSDGFVSVDLNDGRFIWLLADNLTPANTPFPPADFKANAYVIQDGDDFTITRSPAPFNTASITYVYWPLSGWATDNVLHVFCFRHHGSLLTSDGLAIQTFYLPSMEIVEQRDHVPVPPMPGAEDSSRATWDAGLLDDGTDIWIYGCNHDPSGTEESGANFKEYHVARCSRNTLADTFKWEYEGQIPHTSSAASIGPYDSGKIIARGPLEQTQRWTASDPTFADIEVEDIGELTPTLPSPGAAFPWAYGAHAHPHLPALTSGKMLLTVNVNDGPGVFERYFPDFFEIDP